MKDYRNKTKNEPSVQCSKMFTMSHSSPDQVFGYNPSSVNYCYDDPDSYVPDYPDTDAISEGSHVIAPSNVTTELYRRKACAPPSSTSPEGYRHNMYVAPNYYYDPFHHHAPAPVRRTVIYRRSYPMIDESGRYFTTPIDEGFREHEVFSTPQMRTLRRHSATPTTLTPMAPRVARRHHLGVRTPRYYRRTMTNVIKKPSALCLPVSCQPDPASYRRNKRHPEESCYSPQFSKQPIPKELSRRHSVPMQMPSTDDQEQREIHMTQSDVDAVLARYDTIFEGQGLESPSEKCESVSSKTSSKAKMLPKIPTTIKKQQERIKKFSKRNNTTKVTNKKQQKTNANIENLQVEEITPEVLDSMLSELMSSENKQNEIIQKKENPKSASQISYEIKDNDENSTRKNTNNNTTNSTLNASNQYYQSFNYKDISSNIAKSQINNYNKSGNSTPVITTPIPRTPRFDGQSISLKHHPSEKTKLSTCESQSDDNGVLELHRSKSYIVNLIDRALSKELGTIPDEVYQSVPKELNNINTKHAACTMKKHDKRCEKGLCLEITQTSGDSLIPNAAAPPSDNETRHDCTCNVKEEPLYIKQLRQLRWGHLKHIQMEVRRLEDLERFLDSCTPSSR
ncbi:hypothetical protein RN001_012001 [Aquatica leii]|uniref:Uncharacterized protein n=1 Tax=Aquatica leii TaxID=1421715 RepID=A0AAN7SEX6_9COLE|nr:hypothetical protein RN001_012001 [Aquatica leii]